MIYKQSLLQSSLVKVFGIFNELYKSQTRHRFRVTAGLFYKTRLILLKYNKWVILLTQWFEPDKRKARRLTQLRQKNFQNTTFTNKQVKVHLKRFWLLNQLTLAKSLTPHSTYQF